jgi:hypothetical protein
MRKLKPKPKFKSAVQEAAFWASHDSFEGTDHISDKQLILFE